LFSSWSRGLKGGAASTGARGVGVDDLKSYAAQPIAKIERRVLQVGGALRIDKKFDAIALDHGVTGTLLVQRHFVLKAGTTAFPDLHPQTLA
jgi:hypothetical protein